MATDLNGATASLSLTSPPGPDDLSPLEQDVLEEYERLADNMKKARAMTSISYLPILTITCSSHLFSTGWQARPLRKFWMDCCSWNARQA